MIFEYTTPNFWDNSLAFAVGLIGLTLLVLTLFMVYLNFLLIQRFERKKNKTKHVERIKALKTKRNIGLVVACVLMLSTIVGVISIFNQSIPQAEYQSFKNDVTKTINETYLVTITDDETDKLTQGLEETFRTPPKGEYVEYGKIAQLNDDGQITKMQLVWDIKQYELVYVANDSELVDLVEVEKR